MAIFGGLTVAAIVVASVVPLAGAVALIAPVPLAVIAARTRPRAIAAATVTTTLVSFAMAGTGAATAVLSAALVGGIVGDTKRRGRGIGTISVAAVIVGPMVGLLTVLLLWVLVPLRTLVLRALENTVGGTVRWLEAWAPLQPAADVVRSIGTSMVDQWWLWMWVGGAVGTIVSLYVAWWLLGGVVNRLADIPSEDTLDAQTADGDLAPAALPLRLIDVGFSYRAAGPAVLTGIDLTISAGEFVAVVGANGSGKSTLAKVLAGRAPTVGVVDRPGPAGLGRRGGTAMVLQRPETQMLGARVADDVVWGLPADITVDVDALLSEVGLAGLGGRETADLSGGQQQRLAIAAALARDPAVLIADEVTSMVDPDGRAELLQLLSTLPRRRGITVVLVTHRGAEAAAADRIIHLSAGRLVPHAPDWVPRAGASSEVGSSTIPAPRPRFSGVDSPVVLDVDGLGYTYLGGSPWAVRALHDVSFTVRRGDGLLVVGGNGSGKTTLAWALAGLLTPTEGRCLLDGAPISEQVGRVGLSFQHARLQLQKATVGDEIMAAGGVRVGTAEVARVLEQVGLPRMMASRPVDSLSGGQMRRVVLAGLIAHRPEVLILDEPLAGLDPDARDEIVALLARLRESGLTIVVISHDFGALNSVCPRRITLVDGTLAVAADAGRVEPGRSIAQAPVTDPRLWTEGGPA
ncbi:putative ABC transporter ATP-binding protein [Gordonia soli NBRC 108243]|uniref:Putative ABC transporter ATP-binding protein n=1 Tax=Gordonia soli NBRC 108243 TaxID=1223545 RepID=M0QLL0_9ACTN|nr:putative ABC transporter ATP-binding protein [Gordonia soli NBRC 108243]